MPSPLVSGNFKKAIDSVSLNEPEAKCPSNEASEFAPSTRLKFTKHVLTPAAAIFAEISTMWWTEKTGEKAPPDS